MSDHEYDPERALWVPNRRSFFFSLGAALIAPMLPDVPKRPILTPDFPGWGNVGLKIGDTFTIQGVYTFNPSHNFIVTSDMVDRDGVITIPVRPVNFYAR